MRSCESQVVIPLPTGARQSLRAAAYTTPTEPKDVSV